MNRRKVTPVALAGLGLLLSGVMTSAQTPTPPPANPPAAAAPPPAPQKPCADAENRQFDFWVGEWDVSNPAGKVVGSSTITNTLGGCVIQENWVGKGGYTGQSFNTYDPPTKTWHQHWVDNTGLSTNMDGSFQGGKMILKTGVNKTPSGTKMTRITWEKIDNDHVRQHVEGSSDEGKTWSTEFDGRYARRKS
jgi:hypothetical protein